MPLLKRLATPGRIPAGHDAPSDLTAGIFARGLAQFQEGMGFVGFVIGGWWGAYPGAGGEGCWSTGGTPGRKGRGQHWLAAMRILGGLHSPPQDATMYAKCSIIAGQALWPVCFRDASMIPSGPRHVPGNSHGNSHGNPHDPFAADIAAARGGCEAALNRLFAGCLPYLLLVANRTLPNDLRAKVGGSDLVQETFLQVKRSFSRFPGNTRVELFAWLRAALLNNALAESRRFQGTLKRDLRREVSLDEMLSAVESEGMIDRLALSPGNRAAAAEEAERLHAALARLPAEYRRVLQLRNWEGRPFAEIGEQMDRTGDAARKLWARAVQKLKEELLSR